MLLKRILLLCLSVLLPVRGADWSVIVGGPGILQFNPSTVVRFLACSLASRKDINLLMSFAQNAAPGDTVTFTFKQSNNTATQSTFANPCEMAVDGFDTGLCVSARCRVQHLMDIWYALADGYSRLVYPLRTITRMGRFPRLSIPWRTLLPCGCTADKQITANKGWFLRSTRETNFLRSKLPPWARLSRPPVRRPLHLAQRRRRRRTCLYSPLLSRLSLSLQ